mmetsp:Transcript_29779/g.62637  ORF Transcript_29779/g.62637 Transcript_29779/m.62637 type:complete len:105 (-) Transcript_29779:306-620(-)|eukprot:CAMPEP_0171342512 /NCGR_PEP_ID=MMETSP0878-20121228/14556_1 /TAXON_ID=67004 /ORGANISM="Thalassiosira weissflogii, Strain CCMP1336" /LENGTH=104 /DNA_ID=CAMNT_0011845205 /DNA_START=101 /DNA_END=415 /DNA_ORIENTATION=-
MASPTPAEVKAAADKSGAVLLDVRTHKELATEKLEKRPFKHAVCSLDDCTDLMKRAEELMPDKSANVIVYCRSGRRAGKAKEILEQKGYQNVINAGALKDLHYL